MRTRTEKIITLNRLLPSNHHDAPYSEEHGEHWPPGQQFRVLDASMQKWLRKKYGKPNHTYIEQIGGEEVRVQVPSEKLVEWFS